MAKKSTKSTKARNYVSAKGEDGTVQITFTIDYSDIKKAKDHIVAQYAKTAEVPGFRKGKAPLSKISQGISESALIEKTLAKILPELLASAIKNENLKLAIYPKFELISAKEGEPWQVRAVSCEIPNVKLGDYKNQLAGQARAHSLWTPEKGAPTKGNKSTPTPEEKQHVVLHTILESTKVKIPKILLEEEVNGRLAKLLERIEKLGLSLEQYLASIGKNADELRSEYATGAREALVLDLALPAIAQKEGIKINKDQVDAAIAASGADPKLAESLDTPQQRRAVEQILLKRAALDKLTSYL